MVSKDLRALLERLSNAHGVSGYEGKVREIIAEEVKPYVDSVKTDGMGSLIATTGHGSPTVMLAAHMDEIGLMVKYVDDKGFAYFTKAGGWSDQSLLDQRMVLHTEKGEVYGVVGSKPLHAMKEEERKKLIPADEMFVDVGAASKADAEKMGVKTGTPMTPDRQLKALGGDRVTGKAFDNRAGCAALIWALRSMGKARATVHAVFTVQEEVGLKGARTSAFELNPDVALAVDTTYSGDHPGIEKKQSSLEMGKGPAITVSDADGRGVIVPEGVVKWLKEAAESGKIPYQLDVSSGGTTDASAIQLTREGIPAGVVETIARYIHTPVSVASMGDVENTAKLVVRAVEIAGKHFGHKGKKR